MRMIRLSLIVSAVLVTLSSSWVQAITADERCEAYQLAASGQRISAKLHCRAWAKLTGTAVDPSCLDKAEKRFLLQLQDGGPGCAAPDEVVSLGAAADVQMNAVVADIQPGSATIPSLTGKWRTRTLVGTNPDGGPAIDCKYYAPGACPPPNMFAIIDCDTTLEQQGTSLRFDSNCTTPPESLQQVAPFKQNATGSIDQVTGEWLLAGTVEVPGLSAIDYTGEGVFSADGRTQTGFTTAGYRGSGGASPWLATTTGQRVD
jgi:hypothetical protein